MASPSMRHERALSVATALHDEREVSRPLDPVAGERAHAGGLTPCHQAEAVVLDLVQPARTARGPLGGG
jgi:hypothetical protein